MADVSQKAPIVQNDPRNLDNISKGSTNSFSKRSNSLLACSECESCKFLTR